MTLKINQKEKQVAAANYFYNFFQEITALNQHEAIYLNLLAELKAKYGSKVENKTNMDKTEKEALAIQVQNVRYQVRKTYVMYKTISPSLKIKQDEKIDETYDKIIDEYIIERSVLNDYTRAINKILVENVIQELIDNSTNFVKQIYNQEDGEQQERE